MSKWIYCLVILGLSVNVYAQRDPFAQPNLDMDYKPSSEKNGLPAAQVIKKDGEYLLIYNSRVYRANQRVGDYLLMKVSSDGITLKSKNGRVIHVQRNENINTYTASCSHDQLNGNRVTISNSNKSAHGHCEGR